MMFGQSRPARGAWIEIYFNPNPEGKQVGRAPQGVRGLKYRLCEFFEKIVASRPARGAWIEILPPARTS